MRINEFCRRAFWLPAFAALLVLAGPSAVAAQVAGDTVAARPAANEYVVRAGDQLRIRVWPDTTLGGVYPVEEDGAVYLPVIGRLEVAGVGLSDLRRVLRTQYRSALKDLTVSVTPLFKVSVLGAVQRPGLYEVTPMQTVIDAISLAGGFRDDAKQDHVQLVRDGRKMELNTERLMDSGAGGAIEGLQSGDRIMVPRHATIQVRDVLYAIQSVAIIVTLIARGH